MSHLSCAAFPVWIGGPRADDARWHAGDDRKRRDVLGPPRTGADDGAPADGDARQHDGVHPDVGPRLDANGFDVEIRLDDRDVDRHAGVRRAEDLRAGTPADVVPEDQIARVEVGLRPNPDVIADDAGAVEPALDVCLRADEHGVADLGAIEVLEAGAWADDEAVTDRTGGGAPDGAPHHDVEMPLAEGESRVQLDEALIAVLRAQRRRESDFEVRIRRDVFAAVHGADDPMRAVEVRRRGHGGHCGAPRPTRTRPGCSRARDTSAATGPRAPRARSAEIRPP